MVNCLNCINWLIVTDALIPTIKRLNHQFFLTFQQNSCKMLIRVIFMAFVN